MFQLSVKIFVILFIVGETVSRHCERNMCQQLERRCHCLHGFQGPLCENGSPIKTGTGIIRIFFNGSPQFASDEYFASIMENLPPFSPVLTIDASDKDSGRNTQIRYSLVGDHDGRFQVNPVTGIISTTTSLDREERDVYNMLLVAEDSVFIVQHKAVTNVTVFIEDENDNKPEFAESSYNVYIPDNAVGGHFVFGAVAVDLDAGLNSRLVYDISGTNVDKFKINPHTGVLQLIKELVNKSEGYELEIHAIDSGKTPLSSSTIVNVYTHRYQLFPLFLPGLRSFKFAESSENLLVTKVTATSPKMNEVGKIQYYIAGGNTENVFSISSETGELRLIGCLDREIISSYELWVEARDNDVPSLSSAVKLEILVTDVNDNAPVFERSVYSATVKEELKPPLFVIHVQAFDVDYGVNGSIEYRLDTENDTDLPFSLDSKTGTIYTTKSLERETADQYQIIIKAVDDGTPQKTSSATVYIKVLDRNDNPPRFTRLYSASITENAVIGTFVIQITLSDRGISVNANATYTFTENPDRKFHIDSISGNVTVAGWLDREAKDMYLLKVAIVDGSWQAETPLTIFIEDVNDNVPEFSRPEYIFNISETMQGFIGKVSAIDCDKNGPNSFVSYSLKHPSDLFQIDLNNGSILTKEYLSFKRKLKELPENKYIMQVVATDYGNIPLSSEVTVIINVIQSNNHSPTFEKDFYFSPVPENAAIGLSVLQVLAQDKDDVEVNAEIEYVKTGGNGSEYFSIHKKTGWVTVSNPLVGLKEKWFAIYIQANDKGKPLKFSDAVATFAITEENKFAPAFTALSYKILVPENEPIFSKVMTITATDEDEGFNGEVTYSILSGNEEGHFKISPHNGSITLVKRLDFEKVTTYHLTILASDRGFWNKTSRAVLTVIVTDVNDNVPIFSSLKYDAYVPENEPPGSYVIHLLARDADSPINRIIEYSIMESDDHDIFEVNPKSGVITSKISFDYEQKTQYIIRVMASNNGSIYFTYTTLYIHITGKNEFYPRFVKPVFLFNVSESAGVGTTVGQLQAIDEDSGDDGKVYFFLVGSSNSKGFQIDTKTGNIKVSKVLDRESQSRVVLTALAKNDGSKGRNEADEAQVIIDIEDGNDPPVFLKEVYEARVSEAAPLATSVVTVFAVDKDIHPNNNKFSFTILSGNIGKAFNLSSQSGVIYTAAPLDREMYNVYYLIVAATDSGNPPQSGSTLVKIYIDDVNDNAPIFETSKIVGYVLENEKPPTNVMILSVTDKDLPPNGEPFKFALVGGEHKDYFDVETNTGLIKTTKSLDREAILEVKLIVEIQDSGRPPMKSQYPVTIMVLDENDNPSISRPLTVLVWTYSMNFPGGKIADVYPMDLDTVGQYQCQIIEGNTEIFRIPRECDLHALKLQNPSTYTLTVSGNDGKHHNVSSKVRVKFLNFDNSTLENSVSLRIFNYSANAFLSHQYNHFLRIFEDILNPVGTPIIYSIINAEEYVELSLASKTAENSYVSYQDLLTLVSDRVSLIQEAFPDKDIVIEFNPCKNSPCQNKGICRSFREIRDSLSKVDSPSLVFTSPFIVRQFSCQCPRGFSGPICQHPHDPCLRNPCLSGGTCHQDGMKIRCTCTDQFQGEKCGTPRMLMDSCSSDPCKNGGSCQEAPNGKFFCLCGSGFKGLFCEQSADGCQFNRCLNGGTCVSENSDYHCVCASSYFGRHCEHEQSSYSFLPFSYMVFEPLRTTFNNISIVFSTNSPNALLVYNYGALSGGRSNFLALEISNSTPMLSFGGLKTPITRISVNITVSDGKWHKVTIIRSGKVVSVSVSHCNENGDACEECLPRNATCSKSAIGHIGTLNFNNNPLYIGGISTVDPLLERPGQVTSNDFVGCLRGLSVDGRQIDMSSPLKSAFVSSTCTRKEGSCANSTCGEDGSCIDNWFTVTCQCNFGMTAPSCEEAERPFSIENGTFIVLMPQEKYRRTFLLMDKAKEVLPKILSFVLRTLSQNGVVMHSETYGGEKTILRLIKGKLVYTSKVKSAEVVEELDLPKLNDGQWHTVKLSYYKGKYPQVNISIDGSWQNIMKKEILHDFLDPHLISITVGGQWEYLKTEEQYRDISGCIKLIAVNNEVQLQNATGYFSLVSNGNFLAFCQSTAVDTGIKATNLSITDVIVFTAFGVFVLVSTIIIFFMVRRLKLKRNKNFFQVQQKENSFFTNATGDIILTDMPRDLALRELKYHHPHAARPRRPDITERRIGNGCFPALRNEEPPQRKDKKTQNNFVMQKPGDLEPSEHNLGNASSTEVSDIDTKHHYNISFDAISISDSIHRVLHRPLNQFFQRQSSLSTKMRKSPLTRSMSF